ncbi:MAG: GH92 family glycosyl hydrolase [Terracidiphilus sp.]|nr:GH92 family glycosyl hydrolase [Terracidiphilus sp.]MDR3776193.1 GH92 family glycosyl hydrolase [Terracidiphilus sp.]
MVAETKKSLWTRRDVVRGLSALGVAATAGWPAAPVFAMGKGTEEGKEDLLPFVNVTVGTGGHGHTFPGATVPFGMVQLSPDTYNDDWDWCSGYHLSDSSIMGFSHTHLSGTGCGDLLDFLVVPRTGEVRLEPGDRKQPGTGYRSRFSHANEHMHPGYYSVQLDDSSVRAELTATEHAGFHRYTFPASESSHILLDLTHAYGKSPENIEWCSAQQAGSDTILAGHATHAWGLGRTMYIALKFSRPFERLEFFLDGKLTSAPVGELRGKNLKAVAHFKTQAGERILIKAGISGVSTEGALKNMAAEIPDWEFERVQHAAESRWREELGKIRIETPNQDRKIVFYSSLYHAMMAPTLFDDVDGRYRGMDGSVHQLVKGQRNYTTFSLWDTFRAEHPLLTLIQPGRVPDMVNSLIRMAEESPVGMAVWPLQGKETGCMTGYHSAAVIAEACMKGFTGIDYTAAYKAMKKRAFVDDYRGLQWYRTLGYIPADLEEESVSKTLEYDYDDWATAHVAAKLGDRESAKLLLTRSRNYRNYWDAGTQFLRAKLKDGAWATPFDPIEMGHSKKWRDYTESNAWQTTFGIQHDVTAYIETMGGDKAFVARLNKLFNQPSTLPADAPPDIAGMVGQYAHGNEPSHHIAYLYAYAGEPAKTQERVHSLTTTMYSNAPDGMAGNEDCGQMSAWFILSSIGFYAVDPVSTHYVFGSPLFDRVTLALAGGKKLVFEAKRATPESIYIDSVELNGKAHANSWFSHADVAQGGHFVFHLGSQPNANFGKDRTTRPVSTLQTEG